MTTGLSLINGKATYRTSQSDGTRVYDIDVILDLNHPTIRKMVERAKTAARKQSVEGGGALVVKAWRLQ
jgi:hypothetical protein